MLFIKSFILPAVFLFFQGAQSYCIHNRLTNGSFTVVQDFTTTLVASIFQKHIEVGKSECCHYTNKHCSRRRLNHDVAVFYLNFVDWPAYRPNTYLVTCTTGGGLSIEGSEEDHYAFCTDANGVYNKVPFVLVSQSY